MDELMFLGLIFLLFVGIPVGIGMLLYFIPKRLGYPKTAKYLTITYGSIVLVFVLLNIFNDQLFTKRNAIELVEEQDFELSDKFKLSHNHSTSAIGDYYHSFTLMISEQDKKNAISKIMSSDNFKIINDSIDNLLYLNNNKYIGPKITQNYETEDSYVREYFQPSGRKNYAPTFRRISISKTQNELVFEDIDK